MLNYWRVDMKPNTLGKRLRSMYDEPFAVWLGSKEVFAANFAASILGCCKPTDFRPVPPGESQLSLIQRTTTLPEMGPELVTFVQRRGLDALDGPQAKQTTTAAYMQSIWPTWAHKDHERDATWLSPRRHCVSFFDACRRP